MWPVFLERLGSQKMSLAAYLADAKPLSFSGGVFTVGLPGFALHQEVLSVSDNRRLIAQLLSELCQTQVAVEYATLTESAQAEPVTAAPPAAGPPVPPVVQDIVNLFNATLLDRPPRTS